MKKINVLKLALVALFLSATVAIADQYDLAYKAFPGEAPTLAAASIASGDYIPVWDASAGKIVKVDATAPPQPAAGSFTTLAASGASTLSGDVTGDGGDQFVGFLSNQVASTTTAITAAQCGSTFISNSADVMTLPEASTVLGCRLTFVCGTADDFDVNPADGTDQISSVSTTNGTTAVVTLAPSAGDAIRCTDIGGSITLEAIGADRWAQIAGGNGIWTDVN